MKTYASHCNGKTHYPTRAEGDRAKNAIMAKPGFNAQRLNVYSCKACGGYHMGKDRRDGVKEIRKVADWRADSHKARKARYAELMK